MNRRGATSGYAPTGRGGSGLGWWVIAAALVASGWGWRRAHGAVKSRRGTAALPTAVDETAMPRVATDERILQEADRLRRSRAMGWMAASVALVAIGVGGPWAMMARRGAPPLLHVGRGYGVPVPDFAGGLHAAPFEAETRPSRAADDALERFEWVDRQAKIIRIPLADAMELWMARIEGGRGAGPGQ